MIHEKQFSATLSFDKASANDEIMCQLGQPSSFIPPHFLPGRPLRHIIIIIIINIIIIIIIFNEARR